MGGDRWIPVLKRMALWELEKIPRKQGRPGIRAGKINLLECEPFDPGPHQPTTPSPSDTVWVTFSVSGGPPSTAHYAVLAAQPGYATLFGTSAVLLVDPAFTMLPMQSDASGTVYYPETLPNVAALAGAVYYVQVGTIVGGVLQGSNALELVVCP